MTILFDTRHNVKTARTRRFGAGILPSAPVTVVGYTASDAAWWAAESARLEDARLDAHFDLMAAESAALDALERGLFPPDAARETPAVGDLA